MIKKGDVVRTKCNLYMDNKTYDAGVCGVVIGIKKEYAKRTIVVVHSFEDFKGHNCEKMIRNFMRDYFSLGLNQDPFFIELENTIKTVYNNDKKCFIVQPYQLEKIDEYDLLNAKGGL